MSNTRRKGNGARFTLTSEAGELHFLRGFLKAIFIVHNISTTDFSDELIEGTPETRSYITAMERDGAKVVALLRKHLAQGTMFNLKDPNGNILGSYPIIGENFLACLAGTERPCLGIKSKATNMQELRNMAGTLLAGLGGGLFGEIAGGFIGGGVAAMINPALIPQGVIIGEGMGGTLGAGFTANQAQVAQDPQAAAAAALAQAGGTIPPEAGGTPPAPGSKSGFWHTAASVIDGGLKGAAAGAAGGSFFAGVGAVPGAIGGGLLGAAADYMDDSDL